MTSNERCYEGRGGVSGKRCNFYPRCVCGDRDALRPPANALCDEIRNIARDAPMSAGTRTRLHAIAHDVEKALASKTTPVETSRCIHDRVVCERCAKMAVNKHLAREDCGPVAAAVETLSVTHIFDGEEVVTALVDDGPVWIATFGVYSEADEFVKSLQREPGTTVVGRIQRRSSVEPSGYCCPNCANAGCTDCQPATRNLGPEAPGGVGVTDLAARSPEKAKCAIDRTCLEYPRCRCGGVKAGGEYQTYPGEPITGIYEAGVAIVRLGKDDEATGE